MHKTEYSDFKVIAHRGASGYLPEHTLQAAALAHAMGADFIELDVTLTKDNVLVVLHDLYLDEVSNVATALPDRQRKDGLNYVIDFSWAELQSLQVKARGQLHPPPESAAYALGSSGEFRVASLDQMLQLIQRLNQETGRNVGIYIEPKSPEYHLDEGRDIVRELLDELKRLSVSANESKLYLQSFDALALRRMRYELDTPFELVQLIGENEWGESSTDFDYLQTPAGLAATAEFCVGIGPHLGQCVSFNAKTVFKNTALIETAHAHGLFVHAYTLDAYNLPVPDRSMTEVVQFLLQSGLDGVFANQPDLVLDERAKLAGL